MTIYDTYDKFIAALCLWREARGCTQDARRAVLHVILNRSRDKRYPRVLSEVVLQRAQFSSFNAGDPNASKLPHWDDAAWRQCCELVEEPGADPTGGATHYESCPENGEPKWADDRKRTAVIGPFEFYRLALLIGVVSALSTLQPYL
jgi:spore germination cell wall hydrolase CwlJ-like protein